MEGLSINIQTRLEEFKPRLKDLYERADKYLSKRWKPAFGISLYDLLSDLNELMEFLEASERDAEDEEKKRLFRKWRKEAELVQTQIGMWFLFKMYLLVAILTWISIVSDFGGLALSSIFWLAQFLINDLGLYWANIFAVVSVLAIALFLRWFKKKSSYYYGLLEVIFSSLILTSQGLAQIANGTLAGIAALLAAVYFCTRGFDNMSQEVRNVRSDVKMAAGFVFQKLRKTVPGAKAWEEFEVEYDRLVAEVNDLRTKEADSSPQPR